MLVQLPLVGGGSVFVCDTDVSAVYDFSVDDCESRLYIRGDNEPFSIGMPAIDAVAKMNEEA